jgi:hypothetical protein
LAYKSKEKKRAYQKAYRQANAERRKAYNKAYYRAHAERRKAYNKAYWQAHAERIKAQQKAYRQAHAERIKARKKAYQQKMKEIVLSHYSGGVSKCACCGEQNMAFLSIDHIEGGGRKQMRKLKRGGAPFYHWLVNNGYPSGYRVLCINCNSALGFRGYCPHGVLPDNPKPRLEQSQSYDAAYNKRYNQKLRHTVLVHYSGGLPTCSCCGEKHEEFLSIDHINGDGADHRRMGIKSGYATYRWLIKNNFPPGFQVLCMNCNFAKGHSNSSSSGGCPYKKPSSPEQPNQSVNNLYPVSF